MHNITKTIPPAITFLGDNDDAIPVSTAEKFKSLMEEEGVRSELSIYKNQGHGFFNKLIFNGKRDVLIHQY